MDLRFTPEENTFRAEVRAFMKENLPPSIRSKMIEGRRLGKEDLVAWQRILNAKGWAVPHWPKQWGGTGWGPVEIYLFRDEMQQAPAPEPLPFGVNMLGPVLIAFGNEAQKQRFLPRIANLDDWWCQGFSEPGAGSDLASLKTSAKRVGDQYVVNGQKTWTTLAQFADWIFCLVRTDPAAKKQEGISFLLIDMRAPGITVRPIQTIDGGHEVNEVFFDDVKVPAENLVGEENKGWNYAKFLLGNERSGIARVGISKSRIRRLKELAALEQAGGKPLIADERFRAKIAAVEIELKALEMTQLRVVAAERTRGASDKPDPASSILKITASKIGSSMSLSAPCTTRSKARRFSRPSPNCCSKSSGPMRSPIRFRMMIVNAGTSRRSAPTGPARSPRNISTTARPRSMAARTRFRNRSSPRRFWGCDEAR
jgi:pimeloyl-CoA dehydrogenase large subunit